MKKILFATTLFLASVSAFAETEVEGEEFASDERLEAGFLTEMLNNSIEKAMPATAADADVEYGRTVTKFASAPKFGGYFIGKYDYTSQPGKHTGNGFSQRLVRAYVDGTILNDFAYRIQVQTNNDKFHMKDFFVEWKKYDEFKVKVGQFKRAFTFENPMNPWDVGAGDYSQAVKKLAGMGDDLAGEPAATGGRDQGIQVQGDLFPVASDGHRLIHYQLMVANGQGINAADVNSQKDVIGTLQVQPIKSLYVGFFGWTGNYNNFKRNRYAISGKYDADGWTARAEYVHHSGSGLYADAWYATVGVPCTDWLKTYVKYDVYRSDATWGTTRSMYSIAPNIQIHKNLMLQVQYNYVHDRTAAKADYNELWVETYVRF